MGRGHLLHERGVRGQASHVKILVYDGGQQEDEEVEGRAKSRDHHYHERRRASPLFLVSFMLGSLVACVFVTFFLGGRDILHHALVAALRAEPQYWYSSSPGGLATDCYQ